MNKREYCESRESIAYYSGLNGLEIKGIKYGIDDYIYCISPYSIIPLILISYFCNIFNCEYQLNQ